MNSSNRRLILREVNVLEQVGEGRPLVRRVSGLEPDAQGKLLLEFVPLHYYATVTARFYPVELLTDPKLPT